MALKENLSFPHDGIRIQTQNMRAFIGDKDYGLGVLCVAESNLLWIQEDGKGVCLDYPNIALHAVSTDLTSFPHECIYVLYDKNILEEENSSESEEESNEESENITAIRFVPPEKPLLNPIFEAMNECQALYPDSMNEDEEEDEDGDEDAQADNDAQEQEADYSDQNYIQLNEQEFADFEENHNDEFYTAENIGQNNIELSDRGLEVLRRLNINYQTNGNEENGLHANDEQYEDAEKN